MNITKHLTTRNAVALLAGAVLLQPFVTKALNGNQYASQYEALQACEAWQDKGKVLVKPATAIYGRQPWNRDKVMGGEPAVYENDRSCWIYGPQDATRPHVAGRNGEKVLAHFYF